jgi:hypothetical protein
LEGHQVHTKLLGTKHQSKIKCLKSHKYHQKIQVMPSLIRIDSKAEMMTLTRNL